MKTRKQVIEWIVSQDWCDKFIANATTAEQREITTDKKVLLDIVIPIDIEELFAPSTFCWFNSPEGFDFWSIINKEYESFISIKIPICSWVIHKNGCKFKVVAYSDGVYTLVDCNLNVYVTFEEDIEECESPIISPKQIGDF